MIWQDEPEPVAGRLAAQILAAGGEDMTAERAGEIATGIAAYLNVRPCTGRSPARLARLACRALRATGDEPVARRVAVFQSGLVRTGGWAVGGGHRLWVLDLRELIRHPGDRLELVVFRSLAAAVETLAEVWDATGGRGTLGLTHAWGAATALAGSGARKRRVARLVRDMRELVVATLERCRRLRRWAEVPAVLALDA
jgi:hypothetical protein